MSRDRRVHSRSAFLLVLITVFAVSASVAAATDVLLPPPKSSARWRGTDPPCTLRLTDTRDYGLAPMTPAHAGAIQSTWLATHRLPWSGSSRVTFRTCPPVKAMLIGDSLAFSMGLGIAIDEQQYGVEVANAAVLACSFTTHGSASRPSGWEGVSPECRDPLTRWVRIERAFHPKVVIIELGHRDQFNWRWGQRVVHLGQKQFDTAVEKEVTAYVQRLSAGGTKILFLSVPLSKFKPLSNGKPAPESDPARHRTINAIIQRVAARHPNVAAVLNIDKYVSPGGQFRKRIGGHLCRFDGIHFAMYCTQVVRDPVLVAVRKMTLPVTTR